jgi:hypothetical protein
VKTGKGVCYHERYFEVKVYLIMIPALGNFNVGGNWMNTTPPPAMLQTGDEIVIDPESGECILNVPLTIMKGAKITVAPGKKLILKGNVIMKGN